MRYYRRFIKRNVLTRILSKLKKFTKNAFSSSYKKKNK